MLSGIIDPQQSVFLAFCHAGGLLAKCRAGRFWQMRNGALLLCRRGCFRDVLSRCSLLFRGCHRDAPCRILRLDANRVFIRQVYSWLRADNGFIRSENSIADSQRTAAEDAEKMLFSREGREGYTKVAKQNKSLTGTGQLLR